MEMNELKPGYPVPDSHHVARYCYPCTVKNHDGERVVTARAFEWRGEKTADISLSVMERFEGESDNDVIYEVCRHRGSLLVREGGHYVKLKVGSIRGHRFEADRYAPPIIFSPGGNPAHATLYSCGLRFSVELASLASRIGEFFPVPDPVPDVVYCD